MGSPDCIAPVLLNTETAPRKTPQPHKLRIRGGHLLGEQLFNDMLGDSTIVLKLPVFKHLVHTVRDELLALRCRPVELIAEDRLKPPPCDDHVIKRGGLQCSRPCVQSLYV